MVLISITQISFVEGGLASTTNAMFSCKTLLHTTGSSAPATCSAGGGGGGWPDGEFQCEVRVSIKLLLSFILFFVWRFYHKWEDIVRVSPISRRFCRFCRCHVRCFVIAVTNNIRYRYDCYCRPYAIFSVNTLPIPHKHRRTVRGVLAKLRCRPSMGDGWANWRTQQCYSPCTGGGAAKEAPHRGAWIAKASWGRQASPTTDNSHVAKTFASLAGIASIYLHLFWCEARRIRSIPGLKYIS